MDTTTDRRCVPITSDLFYGSTVVKSKLTYCRPQLPALSYLDLDNIKREEGAYTDRSMGPPTTAASPTYQYPTGPPPPYNSHTAPSSNGWPPMKSGVHTPPESRRTSAEEKDAIRQVARQPLPSISQSLPSISEALGVDSHTAYQPPPPPTQLSRPKSPAPASPVPRRSYGIETSQPHHQYAPTQPTQQYSSFRQDSAGPQYAPQEPSKPTFVPSMETRPPLHLQTPQHAPRPQPPTHAHPTQASPFQDQSASSSSSTSMPPPPSSFGYGYTNSTPKYAQANPPPGHATGPIYSPSSRHGPPQSTGWRAENAPSTFGAEERPVYGESVKRHIDLYDLESFLTDVSIDRPVFTCTTNDIFRSNDLVAHCLILRGDMVTTCTSKPALVRHRILCPV